MSWLRNAVAAAAAIIAFFMIGTPISNGDSAMEMQQSAFIAIPQHTIISQQQATDDIQETQTVSKEDAKESISADVTTEETSSKSTYCIVLASQVTQKNAEIFIEKLSKEGYSEVRLVTSKSNMLRIVYGNYASETEAANSLRSLRNKSDYFEQSWVLEIKD
jgi:septal ring-binding cell division protein DamX